MFCGLDAAQNQQRIICGLDRIDWCRRASEGAAAKPGAKLDVSEIESCLDYTIGLRSHLPHGPQALNSHEARG